MSSTSTSRDVSPAPIGGERCNILCGCALRRPTEESARRVAEPPPMPANAEGVDFDAGHDGETPPIKGTEPASVEQAQSKNKYWSIEPGEPLPLKWEDLMPEGAEEALARQQEEFYEMLQKRYSAESTSLSDAPPLAQIEEGSTADYMPQFGTFDVVEELDGDLIRIPGYVVPFDFEGSRKLSEFLLVPYMGACIHTPPPPPNQVIFVRADPAVKIKDIWVPYWLEGTLTTETKKNGVGDAAYTLSLDQLEPYERR